jgi:hypothetical protein
MDEFFVEFESSEISFDMAEALAAAAMVESAEAKAYAEWAQDKEDYLPF